MKIKSCLVGLAASALCLFVLQPAFAADHTDAPGIQGAQGSFLDITDVYAFRSPENPNNLVLIVGVFSAVGATTPPLFDNAATYSLYVDTNGDFVADSTIETTFSSVEGQQRFSMSGVPGVTGAIAGVVNEDSEISVSESNGAKAYAGLRDDHFFFDLVGFQTFLAAPCIPEAGLRCPGEGAPANFFAGLNTATIAVEFPISELPGISSADSGNLNIWSKTFSQ